MNPYSSWNFGHSKQFFLHLNKRESYEEKLLLGRNDLRLYRYPAQDYSKGKPQQLFKLCIRAWETLQVNNTKTFLLTHFPQSKMWQNKPVFGIKL